MISSFAIMIFIKLASLRWKRIALYASNIISAAECFSERKVARKNPDHASGLKMMLKNEVTQLSLFISKYSMFM